MTQFAQTRSHTGYLITEFEPDWMVPNAGYYAQLKDQCYQMFAPLSLNAQISSINWQRAYRTHAVTGFLPRISQKKTSSDQLSETYHLRR